MSYRRKRRRIFLVGRLPLWLRFSGKQFVRLAWVVLFAVIVFFGWRFTTMWNQRSWLGFEPYRVLLLSDKGEANSPLIKILTIWPDTLKSINVTIPPEVVISAVGGYGNYRVAALSELGSVEGVGDQLLRDSLGYTLGVPIHQVYVSKNADLRGAWWAVLRQALMGKRSVPEALAISQLLRAVRVGSSEEMVFSKSNVLRERTEADGIVRYYFEPALTDRFVQEKIRTIWREAAMLQVAVINASGKPYMAGSWSRLPRVAGFDVVSVTDQQELAEKTQILFSDTQTMNAPVGKVLAHLIPWATVGVGEVGKYRAQTVIILGNDSWLWLTNRLAYLGK